MEETFVVNGSGLIPGVPGQYSNCIVVRGDDGSITVTPLPNHHERTLDETPPSTGDPPVIVPVVPPTQSEEPPLLEESPTIPLSPLLLEGGE